MESWDVGANIGARLIYRSLFTKEDEEWDRHVMVKLQLNPIYMESLLAECSSLWTTKEAGIIAILTQLKGWESRY